MPIWCQAANLVVTDGVESTFMQNKPTVLKALQDWGDVLCGAGSRKKSLVERVEAQRALMEAGEEESLGSKNTPDTVLIQIRELNNSITSCKARLQPLKEGDLSQFKTEAEEAQQHIADVTSTTQELLRCMETTIKQRREIIRVDNLAKNHVDRGFAKRLESMGFPVGSGWCKAVSAHSAGLVATDILASEGAFSPDAAYVYGATSDVAIKFDLVMAASQHKRKTYTNSIQTHMQKTSRPGGLIQIKVANLSTTVEKMNETLGSMSKEMKSMPMGLPLCAPLWAQHVI